MKITFKWIVMLGLFSIGLFFVSSIILNGYVRLDKNWQHFIPVAGISGVGLSLFVIKRHPNANLHFIDSMGILLIGIVPTTASFPLLAGNDIGRTMMSSFLVIVTVFWFIYFGIFIKEKRFEKKEDITKEHLHIKQTRILALVFFGYLLTLEFALFTFTQKINAILP